MKTSSKSTNSSQSCEADDSWDALVDVAVKGPFRRKKLRAGTPFMCGGTVVGYEPSASDKKSDGERAPIDLSGADWIDVGDGGLEFSPGGIPIKLPEGMKE